MILKSFFFFLLFVLALFHEKSQINLPLSSLFLPFSLVPIPKMSSLMQAARANPPSAAAAPAAAAAAAGSCSARTRERSQKARSPATGACSMPSRHRTSSLAPASNPPLFSRRGPEAPSGVRTWLQNTIRNRISDFGRVREDGSRGEGKLFDLLSSRLPLPRLSPPLSRLPSHRASPPTLRNAARASSTPSTRPDRRKSRSPSCRTASPCERTGPRGASTGSSTERPWRRRTPRFRTGIGRTRLTPSWTRKGESEGKREKGTGKGKGKGKAGRSFFLFALSSLFPVPATKPDFYLPFSPLFSP